MYTPQDLNDALYTQGRRSELRSWIAGLREERQPVNPGLLSSDEAEAVECFLREAFVMPEERYRVEMDQFRHGAAILEEAEVAVEPRLDLDGKLQLVPTLHRRDG